MKRRLAVMVACIVAALSTQTRSATDNAQATSTWSARTPDGQPDLQGIWTNSTLTPLERPVALGQKQFYTDEELAALQGRREQADHDQAPRTGDPGTYNQFWWDEGRLLKQTSLIVDPPDGRIPPLTPEGARRRAARLARASIPADGPEDRNLIGALHHSRRSEAARRLQQQLPDRPDTRLCRDFPGDDSRGPHHSDSTGALTRRSRCGAFSGILVDAGKGRPSWWTRRTSTTESR